MRTRLRSQALVFLFVSLAFAAASRAGGRSHFAVVALFDGKTLDGWEGNPKFWRVENGLITGGSLTVKTEHTDFLASEREFVDFDLRLQIKLTGGGGYINSGIQIRSARVANSPEMIGYQVEAGDGSWGSLYDESRRKREIAWAANLPAVNAAVKRNDWNEYRIRCEGPRIRTWINGVASIDYTETDPAIPLAGRLGLQIHGGGKVLVQVKDLTIEELTARAEAGPRTPEGERATFTLPAGFTAELVASEAEGVSKPITVAWDAAGRMWTMTATEYPVDANESPEVSARLFAEGGRDKALVFDDPGAPGPHKPRVFAEGLAMPLGLLPYKDGAIIQYGNDIRFYRDTDHDGRADRHEIILTGFGVQDSHLFVHQFTRMPGDWIFMAQGAFNHSRVRTKDGQLVDWKFCKAARMHPDGSGFELISAGPNNIWGMVQSREGEVFIQEANDMGWPVVPFQTFMNFVADGGDRLRPYAPPVPRATTEFRMGGTGLSGLALAADDGWPVPYRSEPGSGSAVVYVANPITNRVQSIRIHAVIGGGYRLEKLPDFLVAADPWFRPIAIHFGPDGCLYVVDWYNKIISHNEVGRNHPERDKTRGRIWRIRHDAQPRRRPPDFTQVGPSELLAHLGSPSAWASATAWQQIVDRSAVGLAHALTKIVKDNAGPADRRLAALWALEGLGKAPADLLQRLAADKNRNLRREAIRVAGTDRRPFGETDVLRVAALLTDDTDSQVRAETIRTLGRLAKPGTTVLATLARVGGQPQPGNYDRTFERYLARWALERHPVAVANLLDTPQAQKLRPDARLLATLALPAPQAALRIAKLAPPQPLGADAISILLGQLDQPAVREAFSGLLTRTAFQPATLVALADAGRGENGLADPAIERLVVDAAKSLVAREPSPANQKLLVRLCKSFRLSALQPEVLTWIGAQDRSSDEQVLGLAALRESGSSHVAVFRRFAGSKDETVRREAVTALSSVKSPEGVAGVIELWPTLPSALRKISLDRIASGKAEAVHLVRAISDGKVPAEDLGADAIDKLIAVLGAEDARLSAVLGQIKGAMQPVLRIYDDWHGFAETRTNLVGPFTVECWVALEKTRSTSNANRLLGQEGGADLSFQDGRLRLSAGTPTRPLFAAKTALRPDVWTHVAVTRDTGGRISLFINGELDQVSPAPFAEPMTGLDLGGGREAPGGGSYTELRVWDVCRTPEQIRDNYRTRFAKEPAPPGLKQYFTDAAWPSLRLGAKIEKTRDYPALLTVSEARALAEKFARVRALATPHRGRPDKGQRFFAATCGVCHQVKGAGGRIGPDLSGAGAMGTEALLRNIITPNAQLESGYYRYDVELANGDLLSGFLVNERPDAVILRPIGSDDRTISRREIRKTTVTRRSLMPEGLMDALAPEEISDLFAYLATLR